jgi:hypothetical protein
VGTAFVVATMRYVMSQPQSAQLLPFVGVSYLAGWVWSIKVSQHGD